MFDATPYVDGEGGPAALAADLASELTTAQAEPVLEGEGWATYRDGRGGFITVESPFLDRPWRIHGTVELDDPDTFSAYVNRLRTADTALYAALPRQSVTAVFNDHPTVSSQPTGTSAPLAGFRDHTARLTLTTHPDWSAWKTRDMGSATQSGRTGMYPQAAFGEFIEDMAHTIIRPDSAEMLEIALTLTGKRSLDFGSRHRLDNGDTAFTFVEETTARAGRGGQTIEIPNRFTIRVPIFLGTEPVEVEARLRYAADGDGVRMGYRLLRWMDAEREAFEAVVATVSDETGLNGATFYGSAPAALVR